jgi:hypothetical protein
MKWSEGVLLTKATCSSELAILWECQDACREHRPDLSGPACTRRSSTRRPYDCGILLHYCSAKAHQTGGPTIFALIHTHVDIFIPMLNEPLFCGSPAHLPDCWNITHENYLGIRCSTPWSATSNSRLVPKLNISKTLCKHCKFRSSLSKLPRFLHVHELNGSYCTITHRAMAFSLARTSVDNPRSS